MWGNIASCITSADSSYRNLTGSQKHLHLTGLSRFSAWKFVHFLLPSGNEKQYLSLLNTFALNTRNISKGEILRGYSSDRCCCCVQGTPGAVSISC